MTAAADVAEHRVKLAVEVPVGKARLYVVECRCGWSSALYEFPGNANLAYAEHKRQAAGQADA